MARSHLIADVGPSVDSHHWVQQLRLPYYTVAQIRNLKRGERLSLVNVSGPPWQYGGPDSRASAHVEKGYGFWELQAVWEIPAGQRAERRGTWGTGPLLFWLKKGNQIVTLADDAERWRQAKRMLRLCRRLAHVAKSRGERRAYGDLLPYPNNGRENTFLEFLRGIAVHPYGLGANHPEGPVVARPPSSAGARRPWIF
ncbi:hypothetical protein [Thiomonas sp.]